MSLYKRSRTWWMHDVVNGVEIRESLKTQDWQNARKNRNDRINEIMEGRASVNGKTARQSFKSALDAYVTDRQLHKAPKTYLTDRERGKPLEAFFGETPLNRITAERITKYQQHRNSDGLSGRTINLEVGLLRRIMKRYRQWARLADLVENLPERSYVERALEEDERKRLLAVASTNPRWMVAYWAAVLALNTTMRKCELLGLRWRDINLPEATLTIRRSTTKTDAGGRVLPLNRDAVWALGELWKRSETYARVEGSTVNEILPGHYVFPACEHNRFDFDVPMKNWRSAWRSLTIKAGLKGLRFHDLRHSSITILAESGLGDQTIMSIAGHVSREMLEHYSHIRMTAKREAVVVLESLGSAMVSDVSEPSNARLN